MFKYCYLLWPKTRATCASVRICSRVSKGKDESFSVDDSGTSEPRYSESPFSLKSWGANAFEVFRSLSEKR